VRPGALLYVSSVWRSVAGLFCVEVLLVFRRGVLAFGLLNNRSGPYNYGQLSSIYEDNVGVLTALRRASIRSARSFLCSIFRNQKDASEGLYCDIGHLVSKPYPFLFSLWQGLSNP
jgi:hypothetical protein